jgi:hypothetical protein
MASYFGNPENGYGDFFQLATGQVFEVSSAFIEGRPKSFRDRLEVEPIPCTVTRFFARELGIHHSLRAYEVRCMAESARHIQ